MYVCIPCVTSFGISLVIPFVRYGLRSSRRSSVMFVVMLVCSMCVVSFVRYLFAVVIYSFSSFVLSVVRYFVSSLCICVCVVLKFRLSFFIS